jgi:hypothetical protein
MKVIGVFTEDFRFFYEVVRRLKARGEEFISLGKDGKVPASVGVVITTPKERGAVEFEEVVAEEDPERAIDLARCVLAGGTKYRTIVIGVDPGSSTGIAVYGEGRLLAAEEVNSPEKVAQVLAKLLPCLDYSHSIARVGHGDSTKRDRVISSIWDKVDEVEVVDETGTTKRSGRPDAEAAKRIAMAKGKKVTTVPEPRPTPGEVRDVQRLSRLASGGQVTLPSGLASSVAKGEMTMDQALQSHRKPRRERS